MFSQLLKIEYDNYEDVDTDYLRERTETTIKFIQDNMPNHQQPYQLDGTVDQASSTEWHRARWCRVTASNAKDIITTKSKQGQYSLLKRLLWGKALPNLKSLQYGKDNEDKAFQQYSSEICDAETVVSKSGFWVNPKNPEFGCSPDGLILQTSTNTLKGVVEIKCPAKLANLSPYELDKLPKMNQSNQCFRIENGVPKLKKSHKYYYQVQMQMALCEVEFCDFVLWTPKGMSVERITFDKDFWDSLSARLRRFYTGIFMPEYFEMRVPRRLLPVDTSC